MSDETVTLPRNSLLIFLDETGDELSEGFGTIDDLIKAAEALVGTRSSLVRNKPAASADMQTLFLDAMPDTVAGLKTAYRNSLFIYHPDHGGTDAKAIAARDAFERLLRNYK
jgi:hypothetical protein